MYLRQRCFDGSVNKTILKPRLAAVAGCQYVYGGFSERKKFCIAALIRYWRKQSGSSIQTMIQQTEMLKCAEMQKSSVNPVLGSGLSSRLGSKVNQFVHVPTSVDMQHFIQIHRNPSITSSDIPLKCKNPV